MKKMIGLMVLMSAMFVTPAFAKKQVKIVPQPTEGQTIVYDKGVPTVEDDLDKSAVRVVPMPDLDHGSLVFQVAVLNKGDTPFNLGVENVTFQQGSRQLAVFTEDEVEKRAKHRAFWSQVGYAALAGAAAGLQSNKTTINSYGHFGRSNFASHTVIHNPGLSDGQLASVAAGGAAVALSQMKLQKTIDALNDEYLQTTTVQPDDSYGGKIICDKLKKPQNPEMVSLDVNINGEHHLFTFAVSED